MNKLDKYEFLKKDGIYIITMDDKPIILSNGKCGWSERRFTKSALTNCIGKSLSDEGIKTGRFKIKLIEG